MQRVPTFAATTPVSALPQTAARDALFRASDANTALNGIDSIHPVVGDSIQYQ